MPEVALALREAAQRLSATSDTARLDAEVLMAHALGASRSDLLLRHMRDAVPDGFAALVERRARHEPVAYIIGHAEFYGLDFKVSPEVLIPRGDSETLVEGARKAFADVPPKRVIDLGTGSGALLVATLSLFPDAEGLGIDRSEGALAIARGNAAANGIDACFETRDWTQAQWCEDLGRFDLVLANPPYVERDAELDESVRGFEPAGALFAGEDGLDDYRILVPQLPELLAPGGLALVEIGHTQASAVSALGKDCGLQSRILKDLAERERVVAFSMLLHRCG